MPTFTDPETMERAEREFEDGVQDAEARGWNLNRDKWLAEVADAYEVDPEKLRRWIADK